ncbi:discoidin domain-containing protein [Kutzneria sp. NPDC051319]|uniref:discoidin domain-containing protein n=1 Tax=Kutzneria sp. NPDC051319 TaxID=3155047 RepID=UPI0034172F61
MRHTRWAEQQFDATIGAYSAKDFGFAVVLGNALLLTRGGYDADIAGVSDDVLHEHTIATIRRFTASNFLNGGTEWGRTLFFDTTFQLYFQLAGRLLWADLDSASRAGLDRIATEQAAYTTSLGSGDDPRSGGWTPHGLAGGFQGDTKLEEMGVYAQSIAPALAWASSDSRAAVWRDWFGRWSRNETGLPAADLANPRAVDGVPIAANTAHNLYDTFLVENHGSFGPHYQEELWRTSGRNAIHFLTAGRPLPEVLTAQPNGERLWRTMLLVASDAGEPLMPMVDDREHLYGRDVLPLAFRAQVLGDRNAAAAEAMLARRLEPYQAYPPVDRITKFSGEPKYEPEARAELAISYLLHEWRARQPGGRVHAVSEEDFFAAASGVSDFGDGPGLLAHQSVAAWAAAVSKPAFVKFAWQPRHDDWLFALGGSTPMFLPSTAGAVRGRVATTYTRVRDGFDGSVTVLRFDAGTAAFATLPTGSVVYASSGTASGEGALTVHNLNMPGVPGLDGTRVYTTAEGTVTVPAQPAPTSGARTDDLVFGAVSARHVRMLGVRPDPAYGYSVYAFEVRNGQSGPDLAQGEPTTASSADTGFSAPLATDGLATTRWAVSKADRSRADSWLAVDLGGPATFDRIRLAWEAAAGRAFRIEVSDDAATWRPVAAYPTPAVHSTGGWLGVDDRAGLVVRGPHPITVTGDQIVLSDGPAASLIVEGYPHTNDLAVLAAAATPTFHGSLDLHVTAIDGHLVLLNLGGSAAQGTISVPQSTSALRLYRGDQTVTAAGIDHPVQVEATSGRVEPPRFTLRRRDGRPVPAGLRATVSDAAHVTLTLPRDVQALAVILEPSGGRVHGIDLAPGVPRHVETPEVRPYPLADFALGVPTFPTDPLPPGMSAPNAAVDDNPDTSWRPGAGGRMVVDLGVPRAVSFVELAWTAGRIPVATVETSIDGRTYAAVPNPGPAGRTTTVPLQGPARYIAVHVPTWRPGDATLTRLSAHE